jgi:hypothetical protein
MRNRALHARILAKKPKKARAKKKTVAASGIKKIDPESNEVIGTFESLEDALEKEGLNKPNLIGALKNGTKYKNAIWKEA